MIRCHFARDFVRLCTCGRRSAADIRYGWLMEPSIVLVKCEAVYTNGNHNWRRTTSSAAIKNVRKMKTPALTLLNFSLILFRFNCSESILQIVCSMILVVVVAVLFFCYWYFSVCCHVIQYNFKHTFWHTMADLFITVYFQTIDGFFPFWLCVSVCMWVCICCLLC